MAPNLTGPARRAMALKAYMLAIRRVSYTEISDQLSISRNLVSTLVQEEQERQWEGRDLSEVEEEKKRAIETYESVIRASWQRLAKMQDTSLNVSGLLNTILSAQQRIDEISGVKAPTRTENKHRHEHDLIDFSGASAELIEELEAYLSEGPS